jgi:hypothetical protein
MAQLYPQAGLTRTLNSEAELRLCVVLLSFDDQVMLTYASYVLVLVFSCEVLYSLRFTRFGIRRYSLGDTN